MHVGQVILTRMVCYISVIVCLKCKLDASKLSRVGVLLFISKGLELKFFFFLAEKVAQNCQCQVDEGEMLAWDSNCWVVLTSKP